MLEYSSYFDLVKIPQPTNAEGICHLGMLPSCLHQAGAGRAVDKYISERTIWSKAVLFRKRFQAYQRGSIAESYKTARSRDSPAIYALHPILGLIIYGSTAQWERRASADLLPQSCSMKNGKYTKYSRIFHTFAWVKISR